MTLPRRCVAAGLVIWLAAAGCAEAPASTNARAGARPIASPIRIEGTWASATAHGASVFFVLSNRGSTADALTGASSGVAAHVRLQRGSKTIRRLPLPAGSEISFDGTKYAVSLTGLRRRLVSSDTVRVTLTFTHARPVTFVAGVR